MALSLYLWESNLLKRVNQLKEVQEPSRKRKCIPMKKSIFLKKIVMRKIARRGLKKTQIFRIALTKMMKRNHQHLKSILKIWLWEIWSLEIEGGRKWIIWSVGKNKNKRIPFGLLKVRTILVILKMVTTTRKIMFKVVQEEINLIVILIRLSQSMSNSKLLLKKKSMKITKKQRKSVSNWWEKFMPQLQSRR